VSDGTFTGGLYGLLIPSSRGRLAALRRGLGRPVATPADAAREFYRLLPQGVPEHDEHAYWTAATVFAAFPPRDGAAGGQGTSPATALRRLVDLRGGDAESQPAERRLLQLLDARRETVDVHLRSVASLLYAEGIALNPARLVQDLLRWDAPSRSVQRRWAREFWRAPQISQETEETA
jgi:CRISPR type I-E-associated protein CasB/Cse2